MNFCNAGPIANSCFLGKDVVTSIHYSFIKATHDLTRLGKTFNEILGHNLNIDFGFVKITINNKNLSYKYK